MPGVIRIVHRLRRALFAHRRLIRNCALGFLSCLGIVLIAQLLYPAGRLLPLVKVAGNNVGGQTTTAASKEVEQIYHKASVQLKTEDEVFTRPLPEVGIEADGAATMAQASAYPFWQRLIPLSSLWVMRRDTPVHTRIDDERLAYFAQHIEKEAFTPARNASVVIENEKVKLVPATPEKQYSRQQVQRALKGAVFLPKTTVRVIPKKTAAQRGNNEVKAVLEKAQAAVDTKMILRLGSETVRVDKKTIAGWLDFTEDPTTKQLQLALKPEAVRTYLDSIQGKVYKAPGTTTVRLIDGREVSRTAGDTGRGIEAAQAIARIDQALKSAKDTTVTVPVAEIPAKVVFDRQYSNTDAGLTALLADVASAQGVSVSVMELGGRSSHKQGDRQFVAASTYKLFVAYAVFKEIDAGRMHWSDNATGGRTVEHCFEVMIVNSDNPCAKALGERIGWQNVEDMARSIGCRNTELSPSLLTTANDLALFLYKLESGSLLSSGYRAKLIDLMKRQIYRQGIPAGTGKSVANKPGFIGGYIHDPAIVYGARGPYIMVVMTGGGSWGQIAAIARQVQSFLGQ